MSSPITISTATTPWLPLAELLPRLRQLGFAAVDLACRPSNYDPGKPIGWDNNAAILDLQRLEELTAPTAALLRTYDLPAGMLLGYASARDLKTVARLVRAARQLGCSQLRLWPAYDKQQHLGRLFAEERAAWRVLIDEPECRDIRFVVEVHQNTLCPSTSAALRLLDGLPPERVGVIYDPGNSLLEGNEPPQLCLDLLGVLLVSLHVKDVQAVRREKHWCSLGSKHCALGDGDLQWPLIFELLRARNYQGPICLENFHGFDQGPDRMHGDMAWLQGITARA